MESFLKKKAYPLSKKSFLLTGSSALI